MKQIDDILECPGKRQNLSFSPRCHESHALAFWTITCEYSRYLKQKRWILSVVKVVWQEIAVRHKVELVLREHCCSDRSGCVTIWSRARLGYFQNVGTFCRLSLLSVKSTDNRQDLSLIGLQLLLTQVGDNRVEVTSRRSWIAKIAIVTERKGDYRYNLMEIRF